MQPSPSTTASNTTSKTSLTIGVLALQGAFVEHISLLQRAATHTPSLQNHNLKFIEVRTPSELSSCAALILPGGESTAISLIAARCGLLEPLREFVKLHRKPVWGTCAGLILLAESANKSRAAGQELIGGLDVRVQRNYFGRQVESFEADLKLKFLEGQEAFHSVFIRAPVVEKVLDAGEVEALSKAAEAKDAGDGEGDVVRAPAVRGTKAEVEILCRLPGRAKALRDQTTTAEMLGEDGDIVAVRQGNVFGTSFHPELTGDQRIHAWWLEEVIKAAGSVEELL
jgi:5'-phosphate synthase pdxT subunit